MKISESILKVRKDKGLNYFLLRNERTSGVTRTYIALSIEERSKYTDSVITSRVECDVEVKVDTYNGYGRLNYLSGSDLGIVFSEAIYQHSFSHIKTFLNAIKKDSEVRFQITAYNGCDVYDELGLVHHTLYGFIGDNKYMLIDYVGYNNTASPVQPSIYTY